MKRQSWPDWANFSAVDKDGKCWWYEHKPEICLYEERWVVESGWLEQEYLWPPLAVNFETWKESLIER